ALIEEKPWVRRKEFLALNPAGTLPVLLAEGDVPVVGAAVIAEYVDETRGVFKRDKRLFAEDSFERAEIRRLIDWYLVKAESYAPRAPTSASTSNTPTGSPVPATGWPARGSPMPTWPRRPCCRCSTISARSTGASTMRRANGTSG